MPSYQNVTKNRKELAGKVVEPGQIICSLNYYDENEIGLLKVDEKPYYNPTLISEEIEKEVEIEIPKLDNFKKWVNKYNIHFFIEKGSFEIYLNSKENKPALSLYKDCRWNLRCQERTIEKIIIKPKEDNSKLWLIVEKF